MASLSEISEGILGALTPLLDEVEDLQIVEGLWWNATSPCIDIYPGDPAQEDFAFGTESGAPVWVVRARVSTADHLGHQAILLALMDTGGPASVRAALYDDKTLGGNVAGIRVGRPSGYQVFVDASGQGSLLGVEWLVTTYSDEGADVS